MTLVQCGSLILCLLWTLCVHAGFSFSVEDNVLQCCISAGLTSIISLWHAEVDVEACQPPPGSPSLPHRFDPLLPPNRFWWTIPSPAHIQEVCSTHSRPSSLLHSLVFFLPSNELTSQQKLSRQHNISWLCSGCAFNLHYGQHEHSFTQKQSIVGLPPSCTIWSFGLAEDNMEISIWIIYT